MKGNCTHVDCSVKSGLGCEMGHGHPSDCPHFQIEKETIGSTDNLKSKEISSGYRLPWTGRALGLNDMVLATARSSALLVGLIGPFGAGKTSLLTSIFANLSKSGIINNYSFAGSYSIQAWEHLRKSTEWPTSQGPAFPSHTPDSADRVPGLLHLAFRKDKQIIEDVLFTDAPGEWFTRWIKNQSSESAQGARWIAEHSTHFLFFVDREALVGPDVGRVRHNILSLARVLSENRRNRPIAVVWTKSDTAFNTAVEGPIREKLTEYFGNYPSYELSVQDPKCLEIVAFALKAATLAPENISPDFDSSSAFFCFRGFE